MVVSLLVSGWKKHDKSSKIASSTILSMVSGQESLWPQEKEKVKAALLKEVPKEKDKDADKDDAKKDLKIRANDLGHKYSRKHEVLKKDLQEAGEFLPFSPHFFLFLAKVFVSTVRQKAIENLQIVNLGPKSIWSGGNWMKHIRECGEPW